MTRLPSKFKKEVVKNRGKKIYKAGGGFSGRKRIEPNEKPLITKNYCKKCGVWHHNEKCPQS